MLKFLILWSAVVVVLLVTGTATTILKVIYTTATILANTALGVLCVSAALGAVYAVGSIRARHIGIAFRALPGVDGVRMRRIVRRHRRFQTARDRAVGWFTDAAVWRRVVVGLSVLLLVGMTANVSLILDAMKSNVHAPRTSAEATREDPPLEFPKTFAQVTEYETTRNQVILRMGRQLVRRPGTTRPSSCVRTQLNEDAARRVVSLILAASGMPPIAAEEFRVHETELNRVLTELDDSGLCVRFSPDRLSLTAGRRGEKDPEMELSLFLRKDPGGPVDLRLDTINVGSVSLPAGLLDLIDPRAGSMLWHLAKSKFEPARGLAEWVTQLERSFDQLEVKTGYLRLRAWHMPVSGVTDVCYLTRDVKIATSHGSVAESASLGRQGDLVYVIDREGASVYAFFPSHQAFGWVPRQGLQQVVRAGQ